MARAEAIRCTSTRTRSCTGLRASVSELNGRGIAAELDVQQIPFGGPAHVIADAPPKADADLIIVGNKGRNPVSEIVLGNVPIRLLHIAHRPVMVIPATDRPSRAHDRPARHDVSESTPTRWCRRCRRVESGTGGIALGGAFARTMRARLDVITAWHTPTTFAGPGYIPAVADLTVEYEKLLNEVVDDVFGSDRPSSHDAARSGGQCGARPDRGEQGRRSVVVGSRGHGGFAGLLLGSVSAKLAEHAACPGADPSRQRQTHRRPVMSIRVGINGFGRIGRDYLRFVLDGRAVTISTSLPSTTSPTARPCAACCATTARSARCAIRSTTSATRWSSTVTRSR